MSSLEKKVPKYTHYHHHGVFVAVRAGLKGKHREHCLCWNCKLFEPEDREGNCRIANILYAVCVAFGLTTPVWECPGFVEREEEM